MTAAASHWLTDAHIAKMRAYLKQRAEKMTKAELRLYFTAWQESARELERLAALEPSPAVDSAYARAQADEEYDRRLYLRLRSQWRAENGQ